MTRTKQIPRSEAPDSVVPMYDRLFGDRDPVAEPGTATGTPGNWWTVFAQTPDLLQHMVDGFALFNSEDRELDPKLRELALCRAGFTAGSQFVFSQHCKAARRVGVRQEQLDAIPSWGASSVFDAAERAVLAYTDDIGLSSGRVADATFSSLKQHLSEVAIIELTYAACMYRLHGIMCRALQLEYDDVEERIVEIAAPDAADADVMGTISME